MLAAASVFQVASAQEFKLHGFADVRVVDAPEETSWADGGLGKTRYGGGDTLLRFGEGALDATAQLTPALLLAADLQYHATDRSTLEAVEAYARYRPVSVTPWRWSVRVGEFFAPISLENEGVGWTSLWTLTPSAINSWVGEELRTLGSEVRLEHRGESQVLEAGAALFWANDPAGELIAARGWSFSDLTNGLGGKLREPDIEASPGESVPLRFNVFQEIDHSPGWHADLTWRAPQVGRVTLLRYDNNADPSTHTDAGLYSWHTYFWSLAAQTRIGNAELIAQGLDGDTDIEPGATTYETQFHSAFLLAGWDLDRWRPALRIDAFSLRDDSGGTEHGNALTAALNWKPRDWLRLTAEVLRVDSWRSERAAIGESPRSIATQAQLAARVFF